MTRGTLHSSAYSHYRARFCCYRFCSMTNDLRTPCRERWRASDLLIDGSGYSFVQDGNPLSSLRFRGFNTTASTTISDDRYLYVTTI